MYKIEVLVDSLQEGIWFPPYAGDWYNGYEIFRYTSPLGYLPAAMIYTIFGADIHISICAFYGIMAFVSQLGFMLFGVREKKIVYKKNPMPAATMREQITAAIKLPAHKSKWLDLFICIQRFPLLPRVKFLTLNILYILIHLYHTTLFLHLQSPAVIF